MGPNRQKREKPKDDKKGGRGSGTAARGRGRGGAHHKPKSTQPGVGMAKSHRDMLVDVLQHVASGGATTVASTHFDPKAPKIVFQRNRAHTNAELAHIALERLGFPQGLVSAYLAAGVPLPEFTTMGELLSHQAFLDAAALDLFATMVLQHQDPGAEQPELTAEEHEANAAQWEEEWVMVETMYDANIARDGAGADDDDSEDDTGDQDAYTDYAFDFDTADAVQTRATLRVFDDYPAEAPLVRIDSTLGPKGRAAVLEAAASVVGHMPGQACVLPLIGTVQEAIAGAVSAKGEEDAEKAELAKAQASRTALLQGAGPDIGQSDRREFLGSLLDDDKTKRDETKRLQQEATKSRKVANAAKAAGVAPPKATPPPAAEEAPEADAKKTKKVTAAALPAPVQLKAVDTAETAKEIKRQRFFKRSDKADQEMAERWDWLQDHGALSHRRRELPAYNLREPLRQALNDSRVVVVGGDTGSGKTTQIPQYVMEFAIEAGNGSMCSIVCTQPRRLAATAVAIRVAEERDETIGGTVGYSIRLESKVSDKTRLLYCTTGIMLRRLQSDAHIGNVSHVIVDEIHERGIDTDFLLILLRDLLRKRKDLKVILMSATMNAALFSSYFEGAPVLSIPGRTHPVEVFNLERVIPMVSYALEEGSRYAKRQGAPSDAQKRRNNSRHMSDLTHAAEEYGDEKDLEGQVQAIARTAAGKEGGPVDLRTAGTLARLDSDKINYELIEQIVDYIDRTQAGKCNGAILVFLPGMAEIQQCFDELKGNTRLAKTCVIFNLHSSLGSSDQQAVFGKPPKGKRKVVLGTNIMETSITIDDAVYVIDTGKFKENRYDAAKTLSQLVTCWVSRAAASQRSGRAGRVRPGQCFRLYTTSHFEQMEAHQLCEMHRVPLESLILQIHVLNLGDEMAFLRKALDPPKEKAVQSSVGALTTLGALTDEKRLTSLGFHLANLPIDVRVGKMIIIGAVLKCLDPVLTIAACLAVKSPFQARVDDQAQMDAVRRAFSREHKSDQLAMYFAYSGWMSARAKGGDREARRFCQEAFLSIPTLHQIQQTKQTYERYLVEAGFVAAPDGVAPKGLTKRFLFQPYSTLEGTIHETGGQRFNSNSENVKCVVAALVAGLYPNVCRKVTLPATKTMPTKVKLYTKDGADVVIHPASINGGAAMKPSTAIAGAGSPLSSNAHPFYVFVEKVKTSATFLRETTMVSPYALILFGGPSVFLPEYGELAVDSWVNFGMEEEDAVLLIRLREQLESALKAKINDPTLEWESTAGAVVKAMERLLSDETGRSLPIAERRNRQSRFQGGGGSGGSGGSGSGASAAPVRKAEFTKGAMRMKQKTCFNCGEKGHLARDCTNKIRGIGPTEPCFICGARAHYPPHCPTINGGAAAPVIE